MKRYTVTVNGKTYDVTVEETGAAASAPIATQPATAPTPAATAPAPAAAPVGGKVNVNAPMPGTVLKMNVASGATVKKGDILCVLEAILKETVSTFPSASVLYFCVVLRI